MTRFSARSAYSNTGMAPPTGLFGLPHGVLSSPDERIAFAIGIVALFAAVLWDGELDLAPVSVSGGIGIAVALLGSFLAPAAVSNEWHVAVVVVGIVLVGVLVAVGWSPRPSR